MNNLTAALAADASEADKKTLSFSFHMPESHQEKRFVFKVESDVFELVDSIVNIVNKKYL